MKKTLFLAGVALITLASCVKESLCYDEACNESYVSISFRADESDKAAARGFFDNSPNAETWEKQLSSTIIYVYSPSGDIITHRTLTNDELAAKKANFAIPRSYKNTTCTFYAVANNSVSVPDSESDIKARVDVAPSSYNGTMAEVLTKSKRTEGFTMSGSRQVNIGSDETVTSVPLVLKRTVAKVAIEVSLSDDFASKYGNAKVKITNATISKAASNTPIVAGAVSTGPMTFTHSQSPSETGGKFRNLFYVYENAALSPDNQVTITLDGIYDLDGNFSSTADQSEVQYEIKVNQAGNGVIKRNGYYRIAATITGITGVDVESTFSVAEWETPITQNVELGS